MLIKNLKTAVKDKLKWESVSSIPEFPLKNYEEVVEKIRAKKFSTGIDYTTANKLAEWLYGKTYGYFFLLLASMQFLVPIAAIVLAFFLGNYWLFVGVLLGPIGFFVANPYNPLKKFLVLLHFS